MAEVAPFYEPVTFEVTSGSVSFGDRLEAMNRGGRSGCRIPLQNGEYRALYKPGMLMLVKSTCHRSDVDAFLRAIDPRESLYVHAEGGRLKLKNYGRMGYCMTGFAGESEEEEEPDYSIPDWGVYVVCDTGVDEETIKAEVTGEALGGKRGQTAFASANGFVLSFGEGRGVAVPACSEYKYLVTAGKEMAVSLGYEMYDTCEELITALNEWWPPTFTKAADGSGDTAASLPSAPAPDQGTRPPAPTVHRKRSRKDEDYTAEEENDESEEESDFEGDEEEESDFEEEEEEEESFRATIAMTVAQLKKECKARGLPTSGRKADLIDRLNDTESFSPPTKRAKRS